MSPPCRLALLTAAGTSDLGSDGDYLLPALERRGILGVPLPWGEVIGPPDFDAAVIRNTWDYVDRPADFVGWCARTAARIPLANPAPVVAWNSDKRYLRELERAGVPTVPTLWLEPGTALGTVPWPRFVVKPAISAGARCTASYEHDRLDEARRHVEEIAATGVTAMVQPHLESLDTEGEVATYVIGGEVSHGVRKGGVLTTGAARAADFSLAHTQPVASCAVTAEHARFAGSVLRRVPGGPGQLLYARVDVARDVSGALRLVELECIEPFLFLEHAPEAAERVAASFEAWLRHRSPPC